MNGHCCPTCGGGLAHLPGLIFDAQRHLIIVGGAAKRLTRTEGSIFGALYCRFGHTVEVDHLINAVYGGIDEPRKPYKVIQVMFVKIRRLLAGSGYVITNWYGESYALTYDPDAVLGRAREAA